MNSALKKIISALIPARYKPMTMFPYPYRGEPYPIEHGIGANGLPFAESSGKRIYFSTDYTPVRAEQWYRIYLEDEGLTGKGRRTKSPHCYVTKSHCPEPGDVIVDLGCAEGFFAIHYTDIAKKIYLIEAEEKWTAPIRETFAAFAEKTVYLKKFIGGHTDSANIRLEDAIIDPKREDTYFIKMDIEGGERAVIASSTEFLKTHRIKMSCCAYHRQDDAKVLSSMLKDLGFKTSFSDGWMLPYDSRTFPFFRKGMIYAKNF